MCWFNEGKETRENSSAHLEFTQNSCIIDYSILSKTNAGPNMHATNVPQINSHSNRTTYGIYTW